MIPALMPTYNRADLAFERGEGVWLYTGDGRRLLDFGTGLAVSSLGHSHKQLVAAIAEQAARVMHVSNLYRVPQAERLAGRLIAASFADSVFFCNSGAEANEGLIKMMRRAQHAAGHPERYRVICFEGAFHGRTLATLAATGNAKYLEGFGPEVDGFDHVPFNNLNALRAAITPQTAGMLVEPVQGEGGVRPADLRFLRELRTTCDEFGLLLGLDEVQIGMGRIGQAVRHRMGGHRPRRHVTRQGPRRRLPDGRDAGARGGGEGADARLARHHVRRQPGRLRGGERGAGRAARPRLPRRHDSRARKLWDGLWHLAAEFPDVFAARAAPGCSRPQMRRAEHRGAAAALAEGLLVLTAGENVVRFAPPLIVSESEMAEALGMLHRAARRARPSQARVAAK